MALANPNEIRPPRRRAISPTPAVIVSAADKKGADLMTEQRHSLATILRRLFLATGLKVAICLIAILAILYAQAWVESFGGSYGGPLRTQIRYRYILGSDIGESDLSTTMSNPYPHYPWNTEQGWAFMLALALLPIGLHLWYTLWTVPRRRERLLAAELRPMYRLVNQHPARKAASATKHKSHPSGVPAWH